MLLQDTITYIRDTILPNVSNLAQTKDESLVICINDGLKAIHTALHVKTEQGIIRSPSNRNLFSLKESDPDVILGSIQAIADLQLHNRTSNSPLEITFDNIKSRAKSTGILQLLDILDLKNTSYVINEENVFHTDDTTLYFPNIKEGSIVYIMYKPKPMAYTLQDKDKELDLPDTLLECLYAFVASRITTGIESYKEFHHLALSDYSSRVKEAMLGGALSQQGLTPLPIQAKGFI